MREPALCTIADRAYLPRLLVMARSLHRFHPSVRLRVLCLDTESEDVLRRHKSLDAIALSELERADPSLAQARRDRSHREYAWTLKPAICLHTLRCAPESTAVMFLDADLMFFASAAAVFDALTGSSILVVPERQVPPPAWSPAGLRPEFGAPSAAQMGHYNGGMVAFARDASGLTALHWWRESCLASCRDASVAGRHGDQWYLSALPQRFSGVTVVEHPGVGLAPWNARGVALASRGRQVLADGQPVVFYHLQSLRLRRATGASRLAAWCSNDLGPVPGVAPRAHVVLARHWRLSRQERQLLWQPCRAELGEAVQELNRLEYDWFDQLPEDSWADLLADVSSELRWRAYLLAGRMLPEPVKTLASRARAKLIRHGNAMGYGGALHQFILTARRVPRHSPRACARARSR